MNKHFIVLCFKTGLLSDYKSIMFIGGYLENTKNTLIKTKMHTSTPQR